MSKLFSYNAKWIQKAWVGNWKMPESHLDGVTITSAHSFTNVKLPGLKGCGQATSH